MSFQCLEPKNLTKTKKQKKSLRGVPLRRQCGVGYWRGARSPLRISAEHRTQDGRESRRYQRPGLSATVSGANLRPQILQVGPFERRRDVFSDHQTDALPGPQIIPVPAVPSGTRPRF